MKNFQKYINEGRGISDIIKEYSDFIYSLFKDGELKIQLDLDYNQLPLNDLRIEFNYSTKYYGKTDPTYSQLINNKLHDVNIYINIDKNNINSSKIKGLIAHELTHIKEFYEIQKKMELTKIKIIPTHLNIKLAYNSLDIDRESKYYYFIYLLYLSLDTEMNARIAQVYHYLYDFKITDKNILLNKLKEHKNWEYLEMLNNFNHIDFIKNNISEIGLESLIKITNDLVEKFKNKNLNKNTKLLNFITEITNEEELYDFYKNFSDYFKQKSSKHISKFKYLIDEVVEDLKGNRPYNECSRIIE